MKKRLEITILISGGQKAGKTVALEKLRACAESMGFEFVKSEFARVVPWANSERLTMAIHETEDDKR